MEKTFDNVTILDQQGEVKDEAWLRQRHGDLMLWSTGEGPGWRLVIVREQEGPTNTNVCLWDDLGEGIEDHPVNWWYTSAPPSECYLDNWPPDMQPADRGDVGHTNADGIVGFTLSPDSWYLPPQRGPYSVFPCPGAEQTEVLWGLGMARNPDGSWTDHRHLNLWYQWVEEPEPEPEPSEQLDRIEAIVRRIEDGVNLVYYKLDHIQIALVEALRAFADALEEESP